METDDLSKLLGDQNVRPKYARKESTVLERIAKIQKIHPDLICPICNRVEQEIYAWVILNETRAICRSCHFMTKDISNPLVDRGPFVLDGPIVNREIKFRYLVNSEDLKKARKKTGLSQGAFSKVCDWSQPYQNSLECGRIKHLSSRGFKKLIQVFHDRGVVFSKPIGKDIEVPEKVVEPANTPTG